MSGLDRLLAEKAFPMAGARVGFLGHHASVTLDGRHAVDALLDRPDWQIHKLFSPEHGFFGRAAAGEYVENSLHPKWGLPVYSLYGEHRSPPATWLEDLDLMVVDLQDLGVRCYTYASTLLLMMRACLKADIPMMVLGRATPLAGITDGPGLDPHLESFVGMIDLPLVYGLGQAELAEFLKSHHSELRNLDLTVFRDAENPQSSPAWIPPSPAIVSRNSALLYPVTVWCEAIPQIDVNRGGADSFALWIQPDFPEELYKDPPAFRGMSAHPHAQEVGGSTWRGWRFSIEDTTTYRPVENAVRLLAALRDQLGAARLFDCPEARPAFFDQLMGSASVREDLCKGSDPEAIFADWKK